jgi:methionine--tRNA ligase beta chain
MSSAVAATPKQNISYPDFEKLDLRVGTVLSADLPEWSKKLIRYRVDFGAEIGERTIFSGVRAWYTPEDLIGKQFAFVVNLEPKKMGDEESQGMMFMADTAERPFLLPLSVQVPNGSVVR